MTKGNKPPYNRHGRSGVPALTVKDRESRVYTDPGFDGHLVR